MQSLFATSQKTLFFQRERFVCRLHRRLYTDCEENQIMSGAKRKVLNITNRSVKPDECAVSVLDKLESQKNVLICYLPGLCGSLRRSFISWLNSSILSVTLPSLAAIASLILLWVVAFLNSIVCISSSC